MQVRTIKSEGNQKFKSEESREPSFEMVMKTEHDSDDEFDVENFDLDYKELDSHNEETYVKKRVRKKRVKSDEQKTGKRAQRADRRMNEEFDENMLPSIEEKIRSFEQQIILIPTNDREAKMNKNIERNIALQKAFREIVTTGCSNRKAASKVLYLHTENFVKWFLYFFWISLGWRRQPFVSFWPILKAIVQEEGGNLKYFQWRRNAGLLKGKNISRSSRKQKFSFCKSAR